MFLHYKQFKTEFSKLNSSIYPVDYSDNLDTVILNMGFSRTSVGRILAYKKLFNKSHFCKMDFDYVLMLNEYSIVDENWDQIILKHFDPNNKTVISYKPVLHKLPRRKNIKYADLNSGIGDVVNLIQLQSRFKDLPKSNIPNFPIFKYSDHDIIMAYQNAIGHLIDPVPILGVCIDFLLTDFSIIKSMFDFIKIDFPFSDPNMLVSILLFNAKYNFFMPPLTVTHITQNRNALNTDLIYREKTYDYLKKNIHTYQKFAGFNYKKMKISGKAYLGIVREEDSEITSKYGSVEDYKSLKSHVSI